MNHASLPSATGRMNTSRFPLQGTVTQKNAVKEYRHGIEKFFCRVLSLNTGNEMMCMFWAVHQSVFDIGDVIGFEARMSPPRDVGEPTWYSITDSMDVQKLGSMSLPEEQAEFVVDYVSWPKHRSGREASSYCLVGDDWPLEIPVSVMKAFVSGGWVFGSSPTGPSGPGEYAVLGIAKSAPPKDIKAAYRRLARQWHPDMSDAPDAARRFIEIQEAYDVLKDPVKRQKYDALLSMLGEDEEFAPGTLVGGPGDLPPHRCGKVKVQGVRLGSVWKATRILEWLARVRTVQQVFRIPDDVVSFEDWGIEIAARGRDSGIPQYASFGIDNADLPFESTAGLEKKRSSFPSGTLTVSVRVHREGVWDKRRMEATGVWVVDEVLSVRLA